MQNGTFCATGKALSALVMMAAAVTLMFETSTRAQANRYQTGLALYQRGDYSNAVGYLLPYAQQGDPVALFDVGVYFANGYRYGLTGSVELGIQYIQASAEKGYALAQGDLGHRYVQGRGVKQNYCEALKWFQKAAEQRLAQAENDLGNMYMNGYCVGKDLAVARRWYQQAVADGSPSAATNLASLGTEAARPAPARSLVDQAYAREQANDWAGARVLLDQAAQTGDPVAYAHIGYGCLFGLGYPRDAGCAAKYFQLAADKGNGYAQAMLGMMFEEGLSVQHNEQQAFALYQQSAKNHNAMGLYYLARAYEFGIGTPVDRQKAIQYYSESAQQGYERARDMPHNLADPNFVDFRTDAEYQAYQAKVRAAQEAQRRAMANQTCVTSIRGPYRNGYGEVSNSPAVGYFGHLHTSCTPN